MLNIVLQSKTSFVAFLTFQVTQVGEKWTRRVKSIPGSTVSQAEW